MFSKRSVISSLVVLILLALMSLVKTVPGISADEPWRAKYWNNKNLAGDPVLERKEADINYDWGDGSPGGVHDDNFSARWRRTLNVPAGSYRFTATMDDGMRVWVDDNLIINSWTNSQAHTVAADSYLGAGDHEIKVEYYEDGGEAVAKLRIDPTSQAPATDWRGEYFNNKNLSGSPAVVRNDGSINFDWGTGSPAAGISADNFSVRWHRVIDLSPGRYRWTTTTDDGVRLWVNNRLIIDRWFDQAPTSYSAETDLPGGATDVRMEYYDHEGGASARLSREQVSGSASAGDWRGEYFNNKKLSGSPALVRNDKNIDFNWGNGSPAKEINADNFSVRWTRSQYLAPGRHRFTAVTDDGVRLWVNGQQIINDWYDRKPSTSVGEITLPGGNYTIKMEYYENIGGARANLTRTQVAEMPAPTPAPPALTGTVPGLRLNMRTEPVISNNIVRVLAQGETVRLLGRNALATWVKVVTNNSQEGWVYAPLLQMNVAVASLPVITGEVIQPAPPSGKVATVSSAIFALNVRSGPGTTFEPITSINRGQTVELLGRDSSGSWLNIRTQGGTVGWSSARYLDTTYPLSSLPING